MVRAAVAGARAHPAPGAGSAPICACVQSSNLEHAHKVKRNCAPKDPATRSGPQRQGSMNDEKKSARSSVVAGRRSRGTRTPWRSSVDHATPPAGRGASRWPRGPCNAASALSLCPREASKQSKASALRALHRDGRARRGATKAMRGGGILISVKGFGSMDRKPENRKIQRFDPPRTARPLAQCLYPDHRRARPTHRSISWDRIPFPPSSSLSVVVSPAHCLLTLLCPAGGVIDELVERVRVLRLRHLRCRCRRPFGVPGGSRARGTRGGAERGEERGCVGCYGGSGAATSGRCTYPSSAAEAPATAAWGGPAGSR
jgi:hypothetical protein